MRYTEDTGTGGSVTLFPIVELTAVAVSVDLETIFSSAYYSYILEDDFTDWLTIEG